MAQAAQMTPQQFYLDLVQRLRMNPRDAMAEVQRRYGAPQSRQQQQENEAKQKDKSELAQAGGMLAGVVAGRYIANNAGKWFDQLTGKEVAKEVVDQAAKQTAQTGAQAGAGATAGGANLPNINTDLGYQTPDFKLEGGGSATPKVISSEGGMSTVELPTGGTQQVPTESLNDSSFWGNVNWGQVAQGGLALAQMYGAYKSFKEGDKVGGAINMAAGAGNLAAATGAVTTGSAAGTMGGTVIPGLNILAGGYAGYKTAEALSDMAAGSQRTKTGALGGAGAGAGIGAGIGTMILPGIGTGVGAAIGAAVGATAGAIGSWTGSSKNKAQMMRDNIRGVMQQGGILDDKFQGTLADGSKYDFGKDGSTLKWKNIDKVAEANPNSWSSAVKLSDAMATAYGFVGQKASDISAWYAKAAVSNANDNPETAIKNMQHFAKQQGITYDMIKQNLDSAMADNRISQSQYDSYLAGASQLAGGSSGSSGTPVERPKAGEVKRTSAGMYMNDQGKVSAAKSMREALEQNYGKKEKK